ncbi:hypothetical protein K3495_g11045 [Podosphaera aphanis]|nr:hypothetical protein K3495_g11045 [Podosphaera aphanis]
MAAPTLRIAVLECDTLIADVRSKYGDYSDIFRMLLDTAANDLSERPHISVSAFDVVSAQQYPQLEEIDAILISGSKYNSFDNDPWIKKLISYVQVVLAQRRVRIIGVCFGHQILGRVLAGDSAVGRNESGWELSVTDVNLTERGQKILGISKLAIHQMHRDVVNCCPEGVELLGSTDICVIQSMYIPQRMITVQGHPEYNEEIVSLLLRWRLNSGILDEETFTDAIGRVNKHHDGVAVAKAFLRFLLE